MIKAVTGRGRTAAREAKTDAKEDAKRKASIFDDILKSELEHLPQLSIPLVNEVFGSNYPEDAPVRACDTEHFNVWGKTFSDATLRIGNTFYHLECQSTADATMALRMLEYDLAFALRHPSLNASMGLVTLPRSCVLYLRHTKNTPDLLQTGLVYEDRQPFLHQSKVVKAQRYSLDDIFEKHLLLLFPFYLMRYNDNKIRKIAKDEDLTEELVAQCSSAVARLKTETLDKGQETLYHNLISFSVQVAEHLFVEHEGLKEKVKEAMGGHYIETHEETIERLRTEMKDVSAERDVAKAERDVAKAERDATEAKLEVAEAERDATEAKLEVAEAERDALRAAMADDYAELANSFAKNHGMSMCDLISFIKLIKAPSTLLEQLSEPTAMTKPLGA